MTNTPNLTTEEMAELEEAYKAATEITEQLDDAIDAQENPDGVAFNIWANLALRLHHESGWDLEELYGVLKEALGPKLH
jgi:hypothetical protein